MIFWIILTSMPVIGLTIWAIKEEEYEFLVLSFLLLFLVVIPFRAGIEIRRNADVFQEQKEYIETYTPRDMIESAALTNKRIELNEWLYKAQWSRTAFGFASLYPADVLELEPIK